MLDRVYVEIGNICNLKCSFCPGTKREKRQMSESEFRTVCQRVKGHTENLFFHVMGEPLLHKSLPSFIDTAREYGYRVHITTNGTLLSTVGEEIIKRADTVSRVSISLHAPEGNAKAGMLSEYLDGVISFAKRFAECGSYAVYRLWNLDTSERIGENSSNALIEQRLKAEYPTEWVKRYSGYRIEKNTFLEYDGIFTWPAESDAQECVIGTCHALRRQIAILADGTVVPCCLDSEGLMPLGNVFRESLEQILEGDMAKKMRDGFIQRRMLHPVCKKCTFARRFKI